MANRSSRVMVKRKKGKERLLFLYHHLFIDQRSKLQSQSHWKRGRVDSTSGEDSPENITTVLKPCKLGSEEWDTNRLPDCSIVPSLFHYFKYCTVFDERYWWNDRMMEMVDGMMEWYEGMKGKWKKKKETKTYDHPLPAISTPTTTISEVEGEMETSTCFNNFPDTTSHTPPDSLFNTLCDASTP